MLTCAARGENHLWLRPWFGWLWLVADADLLWENVLLASWWLVLIWCDKKTLLMVAGRTECFVDKLFLGPDDIDFCPCYSKFVRREEEGWVVVDHISQWYIGPWLWIAHLCVRCVISSFVFARSVVRLWFIFENSASAVFHSLWIYV